MAQQQKFQTAKIASRRISQLSTICGR